MKKIRVKLSRDATEIFNDLKKKATTSKKDRTILSAITEKVELIKSDPHYGDPIAKSLIPKVYIKDYEITNLFRIKLPNYWRMLYTLRDGETEIEIIAFILDIIDHKDYNKKIGYKKS